MQKLHINTARILTSAASDMLDFDVPSQARDSEAYKLYVDGLWLAYVEGHLTGVIPDAAEQGVVAGQLQQLGLCTL